MTSPTPLPLPETDHVDVLIVGAGLSGIGAAYHLRTKQPGKSFAILEGRGAIGGTWDLFRYPGIRSDSDLQTLGYAFKPWTDDKVYCAINGALEYRQNCDSYQLVKSLYSIANGGYGGTGLGQGTFETLDGTPLIPALDTDFIYSAIAQELGLIGAAGVLCLAFPLHPPGRPEKTRLPELEGVTVPVLIIQGESDPFGMPPEAPNREIVKLRGNHSLRSDVNGLRDAVRAFVTRF